MANILMQSRETPMCTGTGSKKFAKSLGHRYFCFSSANLSRVRAFETVNEDPRFAREGRDWTLSGP